MDECALTYLWISLSMNMYYGRAFEISIEVFQKFKPSNKENRRKKRTKSTVKKFSFPVKTLTVIVNEIFCFLFYQSLRIVSTAQIDEKFRLLYHPISIGSV